MNLWLHSCTTIDDFWSVLYSSISLTRLVNDKTMQASFFIVRIVNLDSHLAAMKQHQHNLSAKGNTFLTTMAALTGTKMLQDHQVHCKLPICKTSQTTKLIESSNFASELWMYDYINSFRSVLATKFHKAKANPWFGFQIHCNDVACCDYLPKLILWRSHLFE